MKPNQVVPYAASVGQKFNIYSNTCGTTITSLHLKSGNIANFKVPYLLIIAMFCRALNPAEKKLETPIDVLMNAYESKFLIQKRMNKVFIDNSTHLNLTKIQPFYLEIKCPH